MIVSLLLFLFFFLMGIRNRGKGTGAIRLSSLKSQIPADFSLRPEGAPGTLRGSWHFAGKCARSGSQARLRRAAPTSPAPRRSLLARARSLFSLPAASARPRSPEPLACPPSRTRSSLLFRAFLAAQSPEPRAGSTPPPAPPIPQDLRRGERGRGGRGRDQDSWPITSGHPKRKEGGRSCGRQLWLLQAPERRGATTVRGAQPAGRGSLARARRVWGEQAACRGSPTTLGKSP